MFSCCKKDKVSSPAENVALLKEKAKSLGIDDRSLTTSLGGMNTNHIELHMRVLRAESLMSSKNASKWALISALAAIISAIAAMVSIFK
ncbi:TPA: hypothetical protein I8Y95_002567 [Legionella pneumophila]|nr:hypothetical protein [Legionella pneumophila]HAT1761253.1 hypothetical protein [Legionella pneumophila]HAT1763450.1 hypothetical protein [Legionella pneumophila]HAT1766360.1 hypothetical protein [Legionella pneumophila]HAT1813035.1 hypothetical protein [Legionella pneumophila]